MEFRRQASSLKKENVTRIHFRERNFTTLATFSSRNNLFSDFSKHFIVIEVIFKLKLKLTEAD